MADEIRITIHGNLTKEPELKNLNDGTPVVNLTIASNSTRWNAQTKSYENGEPTFFNCEAYGSTAVNVSKTLHKGMRIIGEGIYLQQSYTNSNGESRRSTKVRLTDLGPSLRWAYGDIHRNSGVDNNGNQTGGYSNDNNHRSNSQQQSNASFNMSRPAQLSEVDPFGGEGEY